MNILEKSEFFTGRLMLLSIARYLLEFDFSEINMYVRLTSTLKSRRQQRMDNLHILPKIILDNGYA